MSLSPMTAPTTRAEIGFYDEGGCLISRTMVDWGDLGGLVPADLIPADTRWIATYTDRILFWPVGALLAHWHDDL